LWEVCQVPDFRKTMTEEHTQLLGQLFEHLTQGGERLPEDWINGHVKRLERYDGDIDTLMARIAHVRTWTYISHRADWIQRAAHWQERARSIEDKLSDVLHQRLTQRFVDRRAALLVRRLRDEGEMTTSVAEAGEVIVEGEHLGRIEGFRFVPDQTEGQTDQKAVLSAGLRALRENLPTRLQAFAAAPDGELVFDSQLRVCWGGGPVARLLPSGDVLAPKVEALPSDLLDGPAREDVRKRAATWVETRIRLGLSELMDARATSELPAGARGVIFQLCENLGVLPRRPIEQQLAELGDEDRKALARLGVRVGVYSLYFPSMLKPVPIRLRAGLWMVARNRETIPLLPAEGRTSMDLPRDAERDFYAAIGYLPLGNHAIRADMVERLAAMARQAVRESREAARRAQQEKKTAAPERARPATAAAPSRDEITEWAIVAAAFGEAEASTESAAQVAPSDAIPSEVTPSHVAPSEEPTAEQAPSPVGSDGAGDATAAEAAEASGGDEVRSEGAPAPEAQAQQQAAHEDKPADIKPEEEKKAEPAALPPGHFRATPQMMSLVGCSEPEMADVMRGLGYRVVPPTEENGLHAFSVKPRFVREREEQRERQRQQRDHREQRRRERPERPNERQFFADTPRRDGPGRGPKHQGPRPDQAKGAPDERRDERPRGPRPPRRDAGGPALRLYATTEKKGEPASDSPFAKLLELKLGGKK
jgi:ATP-dependent RNA helicase SUPV3L1/SUV3